MVPSDVWCGVGVGVGVGVRVPRCIRHQISPQSERAQMLGSTAKSSRNQSLIAQLSPFLHPDVIPVVLGYESTIHFELQRSLGSQGGRLDGQMQNPSSILLHRDELFVVDQSNYRIQVFHQVSGRFLRKWGQFGVGDGEFLQLMGIALSLPSEDDGDLGEGKFPILGNEVEIFILDADQVHVFGPQNCTFLRRLQIQHQGPLSSAHDIAVMGDEIFVSCSNPHHIGIMNKSDGKRMRSLPGEIPKFRGRPGKLWVDKEANEVWVVDMGRSALILVLDLLSGEILQEYGPQIELKWLQSVVCHGEQVIVGGVGTHRLGVYNRSTQLLGTIPPSGQDIEAFDLAISLRNGQDIEASDLAISLRNELFVCDFFRHRVLIFQ